MPARKSNYLRISSAQSLRVLLLLSIFALIHLQHKERVAIRDSAELNIPLEVVREIFPLAAQLVPNVDPGIPFNVLDSDSNLLGYVVQTSPEADHIVGFSGPTNVLVGFDSTSQKSVGIAVINSDDTRDHVRLVKSDSDFFSGFNQRTTEELASLAKVDAVSGATLTSLAMQEAVAFKMGGKLTSVKFPNPILVKQVQRAFPEASEIQEDAELPGLWRILDNSGALLGKLLRTSPYADNTIGYQGPTDTLIHLNSSDEVIAITVAESFDNEPYTDYVREDDYFQSLFNEYSLGELAVLDPFEAQIEGVSGATMTSMAVTDGVILAAKEFLQKHQQLESAKLESPQSKLDFAAIGTAAVILVSLLIGFTNLRGNKRVRLVFQLILIAYLGLINGDMISQAMLVGWAEHGIPLNHATGLLLLTIAALLLPIAAGTNHYCAHLCPHGALQQLVKNRRYKIKISRKIQPVLRSIPVALLAWCIVVPMLTLPFSLVDIEPFDAWIWRAAGLATICVAVIGLIGSLFYPMAYCRFGCPTGLMLSYLRSHSGSGKWSQADTIAIGLCGLAIGLWFVV